MNTRRVRALALAALAAGACFDLDTDATENQQQTGRQDRGRDTGKWRVDPNDEAWTYTLHYEDVVLSPDGKYLLAMAPVPGPDQGYDAPGLVLVAQPLPTGTAVVFPEAKNLARLNFSPDGTAAYLLHEDGQLLSRLELASMTLSTLGTFPSAFGVLDVTPNGRYLVGTNLPTTDWTELIASAGECEASWAKGSRCEVGVFDTQTGLASVTDFPNPLRDLDVVPETGELLLTSSVWESGAPKATLAFMSPATGSVTGQLEFANCADELKLVPGGKTALLAPRSCQQDPISVIDLTTRTLVENLPGFGPVAVSKDGATAVGFTRKADMKNTWGYAQQEEYGLIIVDLATRAWKVREYGPQMPSYFLADDGKTLLTYGDESVCTWQGNTLSCELVAELARYDIVSGARTVVTGPQVALWSFVELAGGKILYVPWQGELVRIDLDAATATMEHVDGTPELINLRPQGDFLVLGEADAPVFHLFSLTAGPDAALDLRIGATASR